MSTQSSASPALEPLLLRTDSQGIVTLRLNRPGQFNALSEALLAALQAQIDALAGDASLRCVVLEASGRAFSAGHDLREMRSQPSLDYYRELFRKCGAVMQGLQALPVPVIARCAASPPPPAASWWPAATWRSAPMTPVSPCRASTSVCSAPRRRWPSAATYRPSAPSTCWSPDDSSTRPRPLTGDWSTTRCPQTNWMRAWLNSPPRSCPRVRPPSAMASACSTSSGRWRWPTPTTTLATSWPAT